MGSAKITFNTDVAQGIVLSPLLSLSSSMYSPAIWMISVHRNVLDTGYKVYHPFNHILFVDDMSLLTQNSEDMQCLMDTIQEFESWSGIPVNTVKTKLMIIDGIVVNRNVPEWKYEVGHGSGHGKDASSPRDNPGSPPGD